MIQARSITPPGANFVRKALDPFHDFEVRVDGIPDENTSRVLIQEVTLSQTFSVPSGITGNWDAHIFSLPELSTQITAACGVVTNASPVIQPASGPAAGYPLGLINVISVPTGGITTPTGSSFGTGSIVTPFDFSAYFAGQKRLLALAFEVHDTTAELYKQGTITCYRLPQTFDISNMSVYTGNNGTSTTGPFQVAYLSRMPPSNLAAAMLLTGSRQWEMKDGAYVVAIQDIKNNMLTGSKFANHVFTAGDPTSTGEYCLYNVPGFSSNGITGTGLVTTTSPTAVAPLAQIPSAIKPVPFHTAGVYCTGLNQNSTFTVTCRAIFESAPTPDNTQLVVLAQPSPDYDPIALEIYKAACVKLPVGVPVGQNASGDFWDKVLSAISSVAPTVGAFFGPVGASLGSLASSAAKAAQDRRNKPEPRKQIAGNFGANGNKNATPVPAPRKKPFQGGSRM